MKVLVIGASGLLAKPVIKHFDKQGFQLRLFSRGISATMFDKSYELIKGDVFNPTDLEKAMEGCDAVHISLSKIDEQLAVQAIVKVAKQKNIQLISTVSGCTVAEENRWFWMIENKYQAEQMIIHSGIPYLIFRPTWFFESLELFIRHGKANIIGKQLHPYHWVAADDFARMLVKAYQLKEARNKVFYILGSELYGMKEVLTSYCKQQYPEIKAVSTAPLGMIKAIAFLTSNKELKMAASLFSYFEKVKEQGNPAEANALLGKPEITFAKWLALQKS